MAVCLLAVFTVACATTDDQDDSAATDAPYDGDSGIETGIPDDNDTETEIPDDYDTTEDFPYFMNVTGEIVSIETDGDFTRISIEDTEGNPAVLVINEDTFFPFDETFNEGDTVTGWYRSAAPMILIWPPEYNIDILSAGASDSVNIRADRFSIWYDGLDGYLISQDRMFAFAIDENTEIILEDGQDMSYDDIIGRLLIVIYDVSTRSIPEQATANKIIVLFEQAVPLG